MTLTYPLTRYRFEFEVIAPIRLPEYAGSTLRGAFGHALRQLACMTRKKSCAGCMLAATCPYTALFEPQKPANGSLSLATPPVPYIIEPPEWGERHYTPGDRLAFHFTLIGRAVDQLPLCIMAWRRAFSRGVGAGEGTAEMIGVYHEKAGSTTGVAGEIVGANSVGANLFAHIYQPGGTVACHVRSIELVEYPAPDAVTLQFLTPLRLQENGHALPPNRLTPRPLLTALMRRASLLAEHYHGQQLFTSAEFPELGKAASSIEGRVQMEWRDWTRRSARQQTTMQLGGCIGTWTLAGNLAPFWNLLRLGEYLHVGKEASFGLGQFRLNPES